MEAFKLKYPDGTIEIAIASTMLELIKKRDLCSRENDAIRIIQLSGEQKAIALADYYEGEQENGNRCH